MRTRYHLYLAIVLGALAVCCSERANALLGASQADISEATAPSNQISSNNPVAEGLIQLDVVVTDNYSGMPVSGLTLKDFCLLDNGQPQTIVSFHGFDQFAAKPDPPVEVIFVIDTVQMSPILASHEKISVEEFLRERGGHLPEPVSVFELADTGLWRVAEASTDGNALASRVAHDNQAVLLRGVRVGQRGNSPASLDLKAPPSLEALKALGEIATTERRKAGRKLLLWIGPGSGMGSGAYAEGNSSREETFYMVRWFSALLREARITLYSFAVGENDPRAQLYTDYLHGVQSSQEASFMNVYRKVLAVQSGGRVMDGSENLVRLIDICVRGANVFYTLSFDPPPAGHPDEYHDLRVQVDKSGLTARTNSGYYDQPYYSDQPNAPLKRATVEEVEKLLEANQSERDADTARQLSGLELTERMENATLAKWMTVLRGKKARQALVALADASAFLEPPPAEASANPPPDIATQQRMIALTTDYLTRTIPKLPNFVATRTTVHYQENAQFYAGTTTLAYEPLHVAESFRATALYRNGREVADANEVQQSRSRATDPYLITYGTFGPMLGFVHDAIAIPDGLTWSHWEQDLGGLRAVFRYRIPAENSLHQVVGCCLPDGEGTNGFQREATYHGEIAIDPASGAILRLKSEAELQGFPPIDRSEIVVDYGPVEIGGETYICPIKSVSLVRMRSVSNMMEWDEGFRTYGPYLTTLNDIIYDSYHIYRGESRILTGFDPDEKDSGGSAK